MNAICRGSLQKNAVATIVNIHQEASWSEEPLGVQKDAVLLAQSLNTHVKHTRKRFFVLVYVA